MDSSGVFKIPSLISQDIALIMGYVDPPTPLNPPVPGMSLSFEETLSNPILEPETCNPKTTVDEKEEEDISSSRHESEDEEVENVLLAGVAENDEEKTNAVVRKESDSSDSDNSDSDSSSDEDKDEKKDDDTKPVHKPRKPDPVELDLDEDGPPVPDDYVPTTHEIPLTSIPIPSLPDPATLPNEPLELVGEIGTILSDTIIVRGGGGGGGHGSSNGYQTAMEKRQGVLDEGSLLLFDDRTPLGYVWETFGPTHLPHYIVRVPRRIKASAKTDGIETGEDNVVEAINANALLDKVTLSRPIYHLRSTSKFVFTEALTRLRGSDASNIHDEELSEHEQEFSDDEAEAAFKRSRRKGSRAPSVPRSQRQYQHQRYESFTHPEHNYADDAGSLYGDSPYDVGESSNSPFYGSGFAQQDRQYSPGNPMSTAAAVSSTSSPLYQNPEVQRALLNARMSRRRRSTIAAHADSPQVPTTSPGPSSFPRSFSFEEYDPRMPRPPSPTSLAIAQATGQWSNGMPFLYDSNVNTARMTMSYTSSVPVPDGFNHAYHHAHSSAAAYGYTDMVSSVPPPALSPNTDISGPFEGDDAQMKD